MTGSFLKRHRTICEVLYEIKETAKNEEVSKLVDEALQYARSMSLKLVEYKEKQNEHRSTVR